MSPTPRPGLTLVGSQAHRKDQHPATPFALHAVPMTVLSGWFLSRAAPRLRNLGWVGIGSENPTPTQGNYHTPLLNALIIKSSPGLPAGGRDRSRAGIPGKPKPAQNLLPNANPATPGCKGWGTSVPVPHQGAILCAPHRTEHHPLQKKRSGRRYQRPANSGQVN